MGIYLREPYYRLTEEQLDAVNRRDFTTAMHLGVSLDDYLELIDNRYTRDASDTATLE